MGVGLASAVLIDATIVRAVLLPASMKPLGDRNFLPSCDVPVGQVSRPGSGGQRPPSVSMASAMRASGV
jgi:RND superfamily putative drug exporter